jgi:hypothetical protein
MHFYLPRRTPLEMQMPDRDALPALIFLAISLTGFLSAGLIVWAG